MNRYLSSFEFNESIYYFYDLNKLCNENLSLKSLPKSLKLLLEQAIRNAQEKDVNKIIEDFKHRNTFREIKFFQDRIIIDENSALKLFYDLNIIRKKAKKENLEISKINPLVNIDLISKTPFFIDKTNQEHIEKFTFLKWASKTFQNLSVFPPSKKDYSLINLEYLATLITIKNIDNKSIISPEAILGTNFRSSMINALGVLGLKSSFLDVQLSSLSYNNSFLFPKVIGFEIYGSFPQASSIVDLISLIKEELSNKKNLDGKIIEFYGEGLKYLSIEDRASICSSFDDLHILCAYFPIDDITLSFIEQTRNVDSSIIKKYFSSINVYEKEQELSFDEYLSVNLSSLEAYITSVKYSSKKYRLCELSNSFNSFKNGNFFKENDVILAYVSSCTSSSNLSLFIQASLFIKNALIHGLKIRKEINAYIKIESFFEKECLDHLGLLENFEKIGFILIDENFNDFKVNEKAYLDVQKFNLNLCSLNTNIIKDLDEVKSKYLMSPALVVAYCLKGNINSNLKKESICSDIFLSDLWPSMNEVNEYIQKLDNQTFSKNYDDVLNYDEQWKKLQYKEEEIYEFDNESIYFKEEEFFYENNNSKLEIIDTKILALLDDNVKDEHILPKGRIALFSKAAKYLEEKGINCSEFFDYESKLCNYDFIKHSCFSSIDLKNFIVYPKEGGFTKDFDTEEIVSMYDFCLNNKNLVLIAGENFVQNYNNDLCVKALVFLGVKVVLANSITKSFRKALVAVGILPLEFINDTSKNLGLLGNEKVTILKEDIFLEDKVKVHFKNSKRDFTIEMNLKINSIEELKAFREGGLFSYLYKKLKQL